MFISYGNFERPRPLLMQGISKGQDYAELKRAYSLAIDGIPGQHFYTFQSQASPSSPGYSFEGFVQQLGETNIQVASKNYDVVLIADRRKGIGLNTFSGVVNSYYDPLSGLVVKTEVLPVTSAFPIRIERFIP